MRIHRRGQASPTLRWRLYEVFPIFWGRRMVRRSRLGDLYCRRKFQVPRGVCERGELTVAQFVEELIVEFSTGRLIPSWTYSLSEGYRGFGRHEAALRGSQISERFGSRMLRKSQESPFQSFVVAFQFIWLPPMITVLLQMEPEQSITRLPLDILSDSIPDNP
jgi:hypothetical protein